MIQTPQELEHPVQMQPHLIPRPIDPLGLDSGKRIRHEAAGGHRGIVDIARPHPGSTHPELSRHPGRNQLLLFIHNRQLHIVHRVAQRHEREPVQVLTVQPVKAADIRTLSRAIRVGDLRPTARMLQPRPDAQHRDRLTSEKDHPQGLHPPERLRIRRFN